MSDKSASINPAAVGVGMGLLVGLVGLAVTASASQGPSAPPPPAPPTGGEQPPAGGGAPPAGGGGGGGVAGAVAGAALGLLTFIITEVDKALRLPDQERALYLKRLTQAYKDVQGTLVQHVVDLKATFVRERTLPGPGRGTRVQRENAREVLVEHLRLPEVIADNIMRAAGSDEGDFPMLNLEKWWIDPHPLGMAENAKTRKGFNATKQARGLRPIFPIVDILVFESLDDAAAWKAYPFPPRPDDLPAVTGPTKLTGPSGVADVGAQLEASRSIVEGRQPTAASQGAGVRGPIGPLADLYFNAYVAWLTIQTALASGIG